MMTQAFQSGFIAIIGRPNVGKSTLLNKLTGEKIAIVSNKPQTTRNKIMGILTSTDYQMVFLDTPGLHKPTNKLGEFMVKETYTALKEVDLVLFMVDGYAGIGSGDQLIMSQLKDINTPIVLLVNKIDRVSKDNILKQLSLLNAFTQVAEIIPISAFTGEGLETLIKIMSSYLQPGPKYFPDDMMTDQPERVIVAEFIREKALELLEDEIPHGIGVEIMSMHMREEKQIIDIQAVIYCEKNSHKGIIIGKQGKMLKEIGIRARIDIEEILGSKVYLELWVKVKDDWRNSKGVLRTLGYEK